MLHTEHSIQIQLSTARVCQAAMVGVGYFSRRLHSHRLSTCAARSTPNAVDLLVRWASHRKRARMHGASRLRGASLRDPNACRFFDRAPIDQQHIPGVDKRPHRLVVRTSRRGRDNPGSTPGVVIFLAEFIKQADMQMGDLCNRYDEAYCLLYCVGPPSSVGRAQGS